MESFSRTVGRGRSRFFGFEPRRVDHLFSESDVVASPAEPRVEVLSDCVALPRRHALYTRAGRRIDATAPTFLEPGIPRVASQDAKLARENAEKCPEVQDIPGVLERCDTPMLLMGAIIPHYGHFLTDSMSRLWRLEREAKDAPVLVLGTERRFARDYERVISQVLGLGDRLITPVAPTLFKTVICPWPAIQLARRVYPEVLDRPHRRVAEGLSRLAPGRSFDRPVYLSRARLGSGHRSLEGEARLEGELERRGYEVVHPETLPFMDQAALFQGDRPIVGAIGSAFHTLLFRTNPAPLRLALLCDRYIHQRFLLQDAVKPVDAAYIRCMDHASAGEAARPLQEQRLILDVDAALAGLAKAGFLAAV